jgi:hypothetical protein
MWNTLSCNSTYHRKEMVKSQQFSRTVLEIFCPDDATTAWRDDWQIQNTYSITNTPVIPSGAVVRRDSSEPTAPLVSTNPMKTSKPTHQIHRQAPTWKSGWRLPLFRSIFERSMIWVMGVAWPYTSTIKGDGNICGHAMRIPSDRQMATTGVPNDAASVAHSTWPNFPDLSNVVSEKEKRPSRCSFAWHIVINSVRRRRTRWGSVQ